MSKNIFFVAIIIAASGLISPPIALLGGLIYGFTLEHPFHVESKRLSKFLLQASVVALGFSMNLHEVVHAGRSGFVYTAASITLAMSIGLGLGYLIHVGRKPAFLISAGTAICGGSAIAAVGPIAAANEEEMAVSLGAVFILNSIALFLFPMVGYALHLSQAQFGLWAALAIHDTSSVVGATARYGPTALAIGTTIKLARALVDRSSLGSYGRRTEKQIEDPVAVVHRIVLPGSAAEHLAADAQSGIRCARKIRKDRPHRHTFPDRHRPE